MFCTCCSLLNNKWCGRWIQASNDGLFSFLFAVEFKVKVVIERVRPDGIPTTNAPSQLGEEGESSQQENNQTQGDESEKALCRTNFTMKEKEDLCSNDLQSQTSEEGYFQCTRCNESFFSRGNLTRHIRVHNKGTEKCEDCGALFTHKATLSKHIKKMHNGEPWTAFPCGLLCTAHSTF